MEPEGPFTRVERTLWTVWNYISDAVNRFLRPQPTPGVSDEANSGQESAGEPPDCDVAEIATPDGEGVTEGERLVVAALPHACQAGVTGDLCISAADSGQDEETERQQQSSSESRESQPDQTLHDDAKEDEHKETEIRPMHVCGQEETSENDEYEQCLEIGSQTLTGDVRSEEIQKAVAEKTASVATSHHHLETEIQVKEEAEEEFDAEQIEGSQSTISLAPEENHSMHVRETGNQCDRGFTEAMQENAENCECASQVTSDQEEEPQCDATLSAHEDQSEEEPAEKQQQPPAPRGESDEDEEADAQIAVTESEDDDANSEMRYEDLEQEKSLQTLGEDIQEMNVWSEHVTCSDAPVERAETWLQTSELTDEEREDVALPEVQSDSGETDVKVGDVSADLRCVDEDPADEERREEDDGERSLLRITSVAVWPESETGQEVSGELESPPWGVSEGRAVVSAELNIPACEETQEGVPENNNESEQDENTTQRFLEAGDYEEFQSAELREEVESEEEGNPANTEADSSLMSESVEETQASSEDTESTAELVGILRPPGSPQETETHSEAVSPDFGFSLERERTESPESPMKTEIRNFRKDLEEEFGLKESPNEPLQAPRDGTEALLSEFWMDEFLSTSREDEAVGSDPKRVKEVTGFTDENQRIPKAEAEIMTETSFFQEFVQDSNETQTSEDVPAPGKRSAESVATLLDDDITEEQDTQQNMEVMSPIIAPFGAQPEMQMKSEMALLAVDVITDSNAEENTLSEQDELSGQVEAEEIKDQSSHRAIEIREEEDVIRDAETTDGKRTTEDLSTEETTKHETKSEGRNTEDTSSGGPQDVIDEEILNLWIETAMSFPEQQPNSQEETSEASGNDQSEKGSDSETGSHLDHPNLGSHRSEEDTEEKEVRETRSQEDFEESDDTLLKFTEEPDVMTSFCFPQDERLQMILSDSLDGIRHGESGRSTSVSEVSSKEPITRTETSSQAEVSPEPEREEAEPGEIAESAPNRSEVTAEPTSVLEDQTEVDAPVLDFSPQRSRISVKNPRVRRPNNPRFLLNMPSAEPTPSPAVKPPAVVPLGGLGLGIKLPGLGSGFPVLKKTQRLVKNEDGQETHLQDPETTPAGKSDDPSDAPEQDEAPHKPKWTPPKLPGFGNPLMSELKTKLKKTSDE